MKRLFTSSLILLIAVTACRANRYPPEAYEALAALRKVQAAIQVGANYQQYGQLLIEAKERVNEASRVLSDGPLKAEIQAAMDTYADAAKAWAEKIGSRNLELTSEPGMTLVPKYSLLGKRDKYFWGDFVDSEQALQQMWQIADSHVEEVARLLGRPTS